MTYGLIDENSHKFYTHMREVFYGIKYAHERYNWLITDCECYPETEGLDHMFSQEYIWLSGKELSEIIATENFQWIWGAFCGFEKDIPLEEVLKFPLPLAVDYNGYYQTPVSLQHPLSTVEFHAHDSSWLVIVSKDRQIIDDYREYYPKSEDLSQWNKKYGI